MSRNGRGPQRIRNWNARVDHIDAAEPAPTEKPYRLLWSTGIVAAVLSILAFVLWGINGAGTLFDMMVAVCS
jgi:hypothetical protein